MNGHVKYDYIHSDEAGQKEKKILPSFYIFFYLLFCFEANIWKRSLSKQIASFKRVLHARFRRTKSVC